MPRWHWPPPFRTTDYKIMYLAFRIEERKGNGWILCRKEPAVKHKTNETLVLWIAQPFSAIRSPIPKFTTRPFRAYIEVGAIHGSPSPTHLPWYSTSEYRVQKKSIINIKFPQAVSDHRCRYRLQYLLPHITNLDRQVQEDPKDFKSHGRHSVSF